MKTTHTPEDCPHRASIDSNNCCRLISRVADVPVSYCIVADDVCRSCCRYPVSDPDDLNPVTASLVSAMTSRILITGHPRLSTEQVSTIQARARANLRSFGPDDPAAYYEAREVTPCCYLGQQRSSTEYDCSHSMHEVTTELGCRSCQDWSQLPNQPALRSLESVVRPPARRYGNQVRKWAVGVTSAPREQPTIGYCLDSLARAGWANPIIFADGQVELPKRFASYRITRRVRQLGAWPNFLLGLQELLFAEPKADVYLMMQDDAVYCEGVNVREYLENHVLWPSRTPSIVSAYCPTPYTKPPDTWHVRKEAWVWGALAFILPRETAREILQDPQIHEHRWHKEHNGKALVDVAIGQWALRQKLPIYYPVPSLVQHIGHVSTVFLGNRVLGDRRASRFAGNELRYPT